MTEAEAKEVMQQLIDAGVPVNGWFDLKESTVKTEALQSQQKMLTDLKGLLQGQLDEDLKKLDETRRQLERMMHGGGH